MNQKKQQKKQQHTSRTPYGIYDEKLGKRREFGNCRKCNELIGFGNEKARQYVNRFHDIDDMAKTHKIKLHKNVVSKSKLTAMKNKNLTDNCSECVAEWIANSSRRMKSGKGKLSTGTVNVGSGNKFKSKAAFDTLTRGIHDALKPLFEKYQTQTGEKVEFCGVIGMSRNDRYTFRPICTERNHTLVQQMVNVYKEAKTNGGKRDIFTDLMTNVNILKSVMARQQVENERLERLVLPSNTVNVPVVFPTPTSVNVPRSGIAQQQNGKVPIVFTTSYPTDLVSKTSHSTQRKEILPPPRFENVSNDCYIIAVFHILDACADRIEPLLIQQQKVIESLLNISNKDKATAALHEWVIRIIRTVLDSIRGRNASDSVLTDASVGYDNFRALMAVDSTKQLERYYLSDGTLDIAKICEDCKDRYRTQHDVHELLFKIQGILTESIGSQILKFDCFDLKFVHTYLCGNCGASKRSESNDHCMYVKPPLPLDKYIDNDKKKCEQDAKVRRSKRRRLTVLNNTTGAETSFICREFSLLQLMQSYTEPKLMDASLTFRNCKCEGGSKVITTRAILKDIPDKYLLVHVQKVMWGQDTEPELLRFKVTSYKKRLELDVSKLMIGHVLGLGRKSESMSFKIRLIVFREGEDSKSGHFYVLRKCKDENWYECNDNEVNRLEPISNIQDPDFAAQNYLKIKGELAYFFVLEKTSKKHQSAPQAKDTTAMRAELIYAVDNLETLPSPRLTKETMFHHVTKQLRDSKDEDNELSQRVKEYHEHNKGNFMQVQKKLKGAWDPDKKKTKKNLSAVEKLSKDLQDLVQQEYCKYDKRWCECKRARLKVKRWEELTDLQKRPYMERAAKEEGG